jgi:hypothetical protein
MGVYTGNKNPYEKRGVYNKRGVYASGVVVHENGTLFAIESGVSSDLVIEDEGVEYDIEYDYDNLT